MTFMPGGDQAGGGVTARTGKTAAKPETTVQDAVSTSASVKPHRDIFQACQMTVL